MNKLRVYLSGATKNVDEDFQNWRTKCENVCIHGVFPNLKFINPITYFNYTSKLPKTDKQCLDLFMWQIERSDVLLLNLDNSNSSIGTAMEVEHAYCKGIPIIAFGNKKDTWYNWLVERTSVVFDNLYDAVDYIDDSYGEVV